MRFLLTLILTGALAIVGCGDDETSGTGATGGGTGATGGGTAGTGGGTGGVGGGTGGVGGGTGGSGGMDGGSAAAKAFCARFTNNDTCAFGSGYANEADCIAQYDTFSGAKQACVEQHLTNAEGGNAGLHCPHAEGEGPCNL